MAARPHLLTRAGHTALAVLTTSALGLVVAGAPPAQAADATTAYSCTGDATTQMAFGFEADAPAPPATLPLFASPQQLSMVMETAVPGALAKQAADAGASTVELSVVTRFTDALAAEASWRSSTLSTQQAVPVGDQTTARDVPVTGRGTHSLVQPGVNDLRAGDLAVTLRFRDEAGALVGEPDVLTCTTPNTPVADTVWVRSVTYLDLLVGTADWDQAGLARTFEVGQPIEVHARVSAPGTTVPAGWVDFTTSDGATVRVAVDAEGRAAGVVPGFAERTGPHSVGATFVPADPVVYGQGTVAHPPGGVNYENPVLVGVDLAPTSTRVRETGLRRHRAVKIRTRVVAAHASTPGGRVRVDVRRIGAKGRWSRTRTVDDASRALARFGRLRPGRYQVVVTYRGDDRHLGSSVTDRFRVRR